MRKIINLVALSLGTIGAFLGYLSSCRVESRFTKDGVALGYGPEYMTPFWRHCGEIGFILIVIAFATEFVITLVNNRH